MKNNTTYSGLKKMKAFEFEGVSISNSEMDETGRFEVESDYYKKPKCDHTIEELVRQLKVNEVELAQLELELRHTDPSYSTYADVVSEIEMERFERSQLQAELESALDDAK